MVGLDWKHCLEYEFQLRKEALRLIRDQGGSSLFGASPRVLREGQRAQKQPLAMKDKPAQKDKGGGKGRGKGKNDSKGGKSSAHDTTEAHLFDEFQQKHKNTLWHEKANGNSEPLISSRSPAGLGIWRSQR